MEAKSLVKCHECFSGRVLFQNVTINLLVVRMLEYINILSPSYLLISVLVNQKDALEEGSTATFGGKKHTGFLLLIFF